MSYNKTTWQTGDKITAAKMNKIEDGIAAAEQSGGSGVIAFVELSASGFSSGSKTFGYIVYARFSNGVWTLLNDDYSNNGIIEVFGYSGPTTHGVVIPIPSGGNVYPFLMNIIEGANIVTTGEISSNPERLYFSFGSYTEPCYRITGSGTITFVAD